MANLKAGGAVSYMPVRVERGVCGQDRLKTFLFNLGA